MSFLVAHSHGSGRCVVSGPLFCDRRPSYERSSSTLRFLRYLQMCVEETAKIQYQFGVHGNFPRSPKHKILLPITN